jgi:hypothetical protein
MTHNEQYKQNINIKPVAFDAISASGFSYHLQRLGEFSIPQRHWSMSAFDAVDGSSTGT